MEDGLVRIELPVYTEHRGKVNVLRENPPLADLPLFLRGVRSGLFEVLEFEHKPRNFSTPNPRENEQGSPTAI